MTLFNQISLSILVVLIILNSQLVFGQNSDVDKIDSVDTHLQKVDSKISKISTLRLDSIQQIFNDKIDTIQQIKNKAQSKVSKINSAIDRVGSKADKVEETLGIKLTTKLPKLELDKIEGLKAQISLNDLSLDNSDLSKSASALFNSKIKDLPKWDIPAKWKNIDKHTSKIGKIFNSIRNPEKSITRKLEGMEEVQKLRDYHTNVETIQQKPEEYKRKAEKYSNKEYLVQETLKKGVKLANKKFESEAKIITNAQNTLMEHKTKFTKLKSIKDVPKIKPNAYKGLPLRKRLIVGADLRSQVRKYNEFYYGPIIGYHLSGTFQVGISLYQIYYFDKIPLNPIDEDPVYGYRLFLRANILNSFYFVPEFNYRTRIPLHELQFTETPVKNNVQVGLGKKYSLGYNYEGFTQVMYKIPQVSDNYNYLREQLCIRFGFYFLLKKTPKQKLLSRLKKRGIIQSKKIFAIK